MRYFCIGDVHGACQALERMLFHLEGCDDKPPVFWFVGDLVNRGPDSAGVLRRVASLGTRATTILGNHDLALLAVAHDRDPLARANDSLADILRAPDCGQLLDWLRHRPLIHRDAALGWTMVHAGIPMEWTLDEAIARARELEAVLRGPDHAYFLRQLFGNTPAKWHPDLDGIERLRYITNALTRQRFVHADGALDMAYNKTLARAPAGLTPWFAVPARASAQQRIVFGHWSALERVAWPQYNVWGIDTGAAWQGKLSALAIDAWPPTLIQVPSAGG